MCTFLEDIMNVTAPTSRRMINKGLDDILEFINFSEEDMKTLSTNIQYPGGAIPNPRVGDT